VEAHCYNHALFPAIHGYGSHFIGGQGADVPLLFSGRSALSKGSILKPSGLQTQSVATWANLVSGKVHAITEELSGLLDDTAYLGKWGHVWAHIKSPQQHQQALELNVSLVSRAACVWNFRCVRPATSFPLLLLLLAERAHDEHDEKRLQVAQLLLDMPQAELQQDRFTDISLKTKRLFATEFQEVVRTSGECPTALFIFARMLRSQMPAETQEVEGNNSVLAEMARRAPCIGVALATARTSIKKGRPLTPEERVALHTEVVRFVGPPLSDPAVAKGSIWGAQQLG